MCLIRIIIKFDILGAQRCHQNLILVHDDPTPLLSLNMKLKRTVITFFTRLHLHCTVICDQTCIS